MTTLAQAACLRCRGQKLRCSRELPMCARCKRLNANCVFPEPTERKHRPSLRRPSKRSNELPSEDGTSSGNGPQQHELSSKNSIDEDFGLTIDQKLILTEVFFAAAFNHALLFHKDRFMCEYAAGNVSLVVMLSMWAMSSHFVHSQHIRASFDNALLLSLGDTKALGQRVASRATDLIHQNATTPTLDTARACLIMSTYDLTQGDYMQNAMFVSIGARAGRVIHQDHIFSNITQSWLNAEMERRVLWTAWWTTLVNNDHYVNGTSADQFMMNLMLPASHEALTRGEPDPPACLADTYDAADVAKPRTGPWAINVSAELSRVILHWARIQDHMVDRRRAPPHKSLMHLLELDSWLTNWWNSLSTELQYSKKNLYRQIVVEDNMIYCLIAGLYYLSKMSLHASVVPHFSGHIATSAISPVMIRISAETALNTANEVANMAVDLIALNIDPSRFPPMYAHCMYVAATIHIAFISSTNAALSRSARKGLVSTLTVLKMMKPYWSVQKKLWTRIHLLYEAQLSRMPYPREPLDIFASPVDSAQEIDQIANANRDTGRLDEPISASVLTYGHRKLKTTAEIDELSFTAQDLENKMRLGVDDVPVAMDGVSIQGQYTDQTQAGSSSEQQQSASYPAYTSMHNDLGDPAYLGPLQGMYSQQLNSEQMAYDPYSMDAIDWSHFDLNNLLMPMAGANDDLDIASARPSTG